MRKRLSVKLTNARITTEKNIFIILIINRLFIKQKKENIKNTIGS